MNSKQLIFKEGIFNLVALFAAMCIEFISTILRARAFSAEDVGFFSIILTVSTILSTVTLAGIGNIFIRFIPALDREEDASAIMVLQLVKNLLTTLVFTVFLYLFKGFFVDTVIKNRQIADYFYILPLYILNANLLQIFTNYLRAKYKSALQAFISNTLLKFINFAVLLACITWKANIGAYLHYYLLINVLINLLLLLVSLKGRLLGTFDLRRAVSTYLTKSKLMEMDVYGLVMSLSAIAGILAASLDRLLLNWFTNNEQVGIYSIAVVLGNVVEIFGKSLAMITHPLIGKFMKEDNRPELDTIYKFTQKWSIVATLPVAIVFIVYSRSLLGLIGPQYTSGALVLSIIVAGQLVNVGTGMCGGIISFSRYYKMDIYTQVLLVGLTVATNVILIPLLGLNGAAIATASSLAIYNIIKVLYVKKKFAMLPFDKSMVRVVAAGAGCLVLTLSLSRVFLFSGYRVILQLGAATLLNYGIIILSGLTRRDLAGIRSYLIRRK